MEFVFKLKKKPAKRFPHAPFESLKLWKLIPIEETHAHTLFYPSSAPLEGVRFILGEGGTHFASKK